jgi:GNAT superfamily N-acetyltransferase
LSQDLAGASKVHRLPERIHLTMKKTRWVNFVWDLAGNELPAVATPRQYRLSLVKAAEREQLQAVIEKSFALDPGWNAALHMIDAQVKSSIAAAFDSESANWLALQHGARIVGGTLLLMTDPDAPAQLVPGPCILMEYRNRGLGTLLLCSALRHLRDAGMIRACAKTRENSPAARFLYPKFGGQSSLIEPLLAA